MIAEVIAALLLLHAPGGAEVLINPNQVTSLQSPLGKGMFPNEAKCLVNLADGKLVAVIESCPVIEQMLEKRRQPP